MSKHLIYKITNQENGKVYIGQTSQGLVQRRREHVCRFNRGERDHKLYLAMKKYGINSFKFEVLCHAISKEFLSELEVEFIAEYNSFNRGYNMTKGGDSVSEATKQKISAKLKGRVIHWHEKMLASRRLNMDDKTVKTHSVVFPDGSLNIVRNIAQFCRDNKVDVSNLYHNRGTGKLTKGYSLL